MLVEQSQIKRGQATLLGMKIQSILRIDFLEIVCIYDTDYSKRYR